MQGKGFSRRLIALGIAGSLSSVAPAATAVVSFDQNITPDVIFGAGNANGSWTVDRAAGIELGLRAKVRYDLATDSPQNIFNSNGDGTYNHLAGAPLAFPTRARWSFEWAINSNYDGSSGKNLDDLTYQLSLDFNPSAATTFLSADPINTGSCAASQHAIGNNGTANGGGVICISDANYAALIAGNNVAQDSSQLNFFAPFPAFDPNTQGSYSFRLQAFDGGPTPVASTTIVVNVVPEPGTLMLLAPGLLGLGMSGRLRQRRLARA